MPYIDIHVHLHMDDPLMDRHVEQALAKSVGGLLVHAVPNDICPPLGDNDHVLAAMRKHPGMVFGSMQLDLRDDPAKSIETIRRYAGEGFTCVKLYPNLGFDPSDPRHEPVWAEMEKHRLLCLSHCGYILISPIYPRLPLSSLTASPMHFERPARMFPGSQINTAGFPAMRQFVSRLK